jgi:hypothetical protein
LLSCPRSHLADRVPSMTVLEGHHRLSRIMLGQRAGANEAPA